MASPQTRTPLSFWERLYLVNIVRGLFITLGHVVRNVFKNKERMARTIEYPDVRKEMPYNYKGAHRLTVRPDGKVKCVACMCCSTVCPAKCITIVAEEDSDDPIEKYPLSFDIDMLRCIYCGFCVEACPKDAIRMDTAVYEINSFTRHDMVHNKDYMVDLNNVAKVNLMESVGKEPRQTNFKSASKAGDWYRSHPNQAADGFQQDEPAFIDPIKRA